MVANLPKTPNAYLVFDMPYTEVDTICLGGIHKWKNNTKHTKLSLLLQHMISL